MSNNTVHSLGRILYIEPNDVFDNSLSQKDEEALSNVSITPKYEDMCISFNLMIDKFSRLFKSGQSGGSNGDKSVSISWTSTMDTMLKKPSSVSVLEGELDNGGKNFLSTYYTDITFDSYKEKTQIEGLGVESVQISYESWYTPTVVIKFVDVRGSAIFGREEAIHVDEQMTVDNIFGSFFTYPYPRFRLQVKGFYGKPVTFQLVCSQFKGNLNANTGNFEATATFIAYSWSLLTEVPFMFLVAAPNASYIGANYWNEHVNSPEWQLWDTNGENTPPPKLDEMFINIRSAVDIINEDIEQKSREESDKVANLNRENDLMQTIMSNRNSFITKLEEDVDSFIEDNGKTEVKKEGTKQQIILFSDKEEVELREETIKQYNEFYKKLEEYTTTFKGEISTNESPNKWNEKIPQKLVFKKIFNIEKNENGAIQNIKYTSLDLENNMFDDNSVSNDIGKIKEINFNDNLKLTDSSARTLQQSFNNKDNRLKEYAYLIDLYNLNALVEDRTKAISVDNQKVIDEINEGIQETIVRLIHFKPYIGNVFKIIFCHLETFCHIMFDSAKDIDKQTKDGARGRANLGISESSDGFGGTDFLNKKGDFEKNVGPWPAIFNNGIDTSTQGKFETGYKSDISNVYGWPGDFPGHKFLEEKVVYSLQEGIEHMVDKIDNINTNTKNPPSNYLNFPILPSDFAENDNPFKEAVNDDVSDLAGHLAIRAAGIIGVTYPTMSESLAKTIGELDACNFYLSVGSSGGLTRITNVLKDKSNDQKVFSDIVTCSNGGDDYAFNKKGETGSKVYHKFETAYLGSVVYNGKKIQRHPMFIENGDSYDVNHWYDSKGIEYAPTEIKNFKNYEVDLKPLNAGGSYKIIPSYYTDGGKTYNWIYRCNSSRIEGFSETYENKQMFNIFTDSSAVERIVNKATEMKAGGVKANDYEIKSDLNDFVNTFIKADNSYKSRYFNDISNMFSGKLSKLNFTLGKPSLLSERTQSETENSLDYVIKLFDVVKGKDKNENKSWTNVENSVSIDGECNFKFNGNSFSYDECVVQQLKTYMRTSNNECSLFGTSFYYLQNDIADEKTKLYAKTILFLHTFKYDFTKLMNVFDKDKRNGCVEVVPKAYLLLLGGLLWRKRRGNDIFIYKSHSKTAGMYKVVGLDETFLTKSTSGKKFYFIVPPRGSFDKKSNSNRAKVSELFGGHEKIDKNIENRLVALFENFVENEASSILQNLEIRYYDIKTDKETELKELDFFKLTNLLKGEINTWNYFSKDISKLYKLAQVALSDKYVSVKPLDNYHAVSLLMSETNPVQEKIKDLYFNCYAVYDACNRVLGTSPNEVNNDKIKVKKSLWENYINGFYGAIKEIGNEETVSIGGVVNMNVSKETNRNRDLSISIYYYLKNLWDKWLLPSKDTYFDVKSNYNVKGEEGFFNNFIFIDSFYRNVYHKLAINCQLLLNAFERLEDNASLFSFLGKIVTDHKCLLLPVPDYIGFNNDSRDVNEEVMKDLFRPMPYNEMPRASNSNKFVVIYTHNPASHPSEDNYYKTDGYDIWSHNGTISKFTNEAEALFSEGEKDENKTNTTIATRFGYYVPSFGVAFGRQNNHLFKNLNVSMDAPVMTEQGILAMWNIAMKGSTSGRSLCFTGQDTFNVFSNYSYNIEVEMMGNAQICPLMYFQFLNVPMWRGTYMIYKVSHEMTAGNMITRFSGMKMSKFAKPFNTDFFTIVKTIKIDTPTYHLNNDCNDGNSDSGEVLSVAPYNGQAVKDERLKRILQYSNLFSDRRYTVFNVASDSKLKGNKNYKVYINGKEQTHYFKEYNHKIDPSCQMAVFSHYRWEGIDPDSIKDISTANKAQIDKNLLKLGFECVWHGNKEQAIKNQKNFFPGDICYYFSSHGRTHACMWDGENWVSDFVQKGIWVYGNNNTRNGDEGVVIYRYAPFWK